MRQINEMFTAWPFLGWRRMALMLWAQGRKRVPQRMRRLGLAFGRGRYDRKVISEVATTGSIDRDDIWETGREDGQAKTAIV